MATRGVPLLPPNVRSISYSELVRRAWGDDWHKKDVVYEFSNGRKFVDSGTNGGPYTGTATGT